jgi:hypothetical protein
LTHQQQHGRLKLSSSRRATTWVTLVALATGAVVSLLLGLYGAKHEPTFQAITTLGFSSLIGMKVWLSVVAGVLAMGQVLGALLMYGKLPLAAPPWIGTAHRVSGYSAVLVSLPVASNCLWALGFQYSDTRVLVHSLAGCALYGAFVVKVVAVRSSSGPSWFLPVAGGVVLTLLVTLVLTSAGWYLSQIGLPSADSY